jgi:hypothetical protein
MKSKLLIGIMMLLALNLCSCYIKPPYHMDDDRGYYRDKDHKEHHYKTPPKRKDR